MAARLMFLATWVVVAASEERNPGASSTGTTATLLVFNGLGHDFGFLPLPHTHQLLDPAPAPEAARVRACPAARSCRRMSAVARPNCSEGAYSQHPSIRLCSSTMHHYGGRCGHGYGGHSSASDCGTDNTRASSRNQCASRRPTSFTSKKPRANSTKLPPTPCLFGVGRAS